MSSYSSNLGHQKSQEEGGETAAQAAEEGRPKKGFVTSPNYPNLYPNGIHETTTIQVDQGKRIKLQFGKDFHIEDCCDYVEITDQDGTVLKGKGKGKERGSRGSKPFVSKSAIVNVLFHTDGSVQRNGWSLFWGKLGTFSTP